MDERGKKVAKRTNVKFLEVKKQIWKWEGNVSVLVHKWWKSTEDVEEEEETKKFMKMLIGKYLIKFLLHFMSKLLH